MSKLTIESRREPSALLLLLSGSLDSETSDLFDRTITDAMKAGISSFVVDLKGVTYVSSAGIGVLVGCLNQLHDQKNPGDLRLSSVSPKIIRILEMLSLYDLFATYPTAEEALQSWPSN